MKERASEPSHLRSPPDSLPIHSKHHSSNKALKKKQQIERKVQRFDDTFLQPWSASYMQTQYSFYDVKNSSILFPPYARMIHELPVIFPTTDYYSTVQTPTVEVQSPTVSFTTVQLSTPTVKTTTTVKINTVQPITTVKTATVQSTTTTEKQSTTVIGHFREILCDSKFSFFPHYSHPPYIGCLERMRCVFLMSLC